MINGHVSDYSSIITQRWITLGDKEEDDVFKFTAYWLAFVQLFNYRHDKQEEKSESSRITQYCKEKADILVHIIDFENTYLDEFKKQPVVKGTESISKDHNEKSITLIERHVKETLKRKKDSINSRDDIGKIAQDYCNICDSLVNPKRRVISLFCSIYRVRCNLFHGSKRLADDVNWGRDERLVHASVEILRLCLPALYESTYGKKYE